MSNVTDFLSSAADLASAVALAVPGPAGIAAKIAAVALKTGTALASQGKDPVTEITRMLSPNKAVQGVHDEWDDFIERNFPKTQPPSASSENPYEDEECQPWPKRSITITYEIVTPESAEEGEAEERGDG